MLPCKMGGDRLHRVCVLMICQLHMYRTALYNTLVSVGSASVGTWCIQWSRNCIFKVRMITSSWYVYITEVNLNSDSLGGIQLRVGRKPYKCLVSFLSIPAGFLGIEDGLGMML